MASTLLPAFDGLELKISLLVHHLDSKVTAKRAPLLATENQSPAKKPSSNPAAQARKEKLARLAQNLRSMEKADRGESPSPPPPPTTQSQQHPRKRVSGNRINNINTFA